MTGVQTCALPISPGSRSRLGTLEKEPWGQSHPVNADSLEGEDNKQQKEGDFFGRVNRSSIPDTMEEDEGNESDSGVDSLSVSSQNTALRTNRKCEDCREQNGQVWPTQISNTDGLTDITSNAVLTP